MAKVYWGCCDPDNNMNGDNNNDFVTCLRCKKRYHIECISINESFLSKEIRATWNCPECVNKLPKSKKNDSTPIRNTSNNRGNKRPALKSPPGDTSKSHITRDDIQDIANDDDEAMTKKMDENFLRMRQDMINVFNETLKPINAELSQIKESMNFLNGQFEDMKKLMR
ncbi:unnamed protein product [Diatraea saccharalis]|uniref:PHD-type domain-containing protein n=1 Tax=Diatraea saccharalis TaxID=40085 RepID=A0A9N9WC88_9NEOP|nr:unnamed protein product [Diatraea saccharalis]